MPNILPPPTLSGTHIASGRLYLLAPIGSGSGGTVYHAIDTSTRREYAVKCLVRAREGSRERAFQEREVRLWGAVRGVEGVVALHEVIEQDAAEGGKGERQGEGKGDGYVFMVMDLCNGGDLFSYLTDGHTFVRDAGRVKDVFAQLVRALEGCHERGVFHRDLKPENVLVRFDDRGRMRVYLADFGLATDAEWSCNFGAGTGAYMSPECIGSPSTSHPSPPYSPASNDVWALGILLLSLLTAHNPWHRAVLSDPCFRAYVFDPGFFRRMLPISRETDAVLRGVFREEGGRVGVGRLGGEVRGVGRFWREEEEEDDELRTLEGEEEDVFGGQGDLEIEEVRILDEEEVRVIDEKAALRSVDAALDALRPHTHQHHNTPAQTHNVTLPSRRATLDSDDDTNSNSNSRTDPSCYSHDTTDDINDIMNQTNQTSQQQSYEQNPQHKQPYNEKHNDNDLLTPCPNSNTKPNAKSHRMCTSPSLGVGVDMGVGMLRRFMERIFV
ncbi:kinase-like protein [Trametopsis cervina]|nr:kinase-like protein [Trametopsis cervina]